MRRRSNRARSNVPATSLAGPDAPGTPEDQLAGFSAPLRRRLCDHASASALPATRAPTHGHVDEAVDVGSVGL